MFDGDWEFNLRIEMNDKNCESFNEDLLGVIRSPCKIVSKERARSIKLFWVPDDFNRAILTS